MHPPTLVESIEIGPDLRLEPLELRHASDLFRLVDRDRDRLGARLPWVASTRTPEDTRAFIAGSKARRDPTTGGDGSGDWAILAGGPEALGPVGVIGIHAPSWSHRRVSLGYWIEGSFEGRGWITRAAAALTRHLHGGGMHRVEIRAALDNRRSRAVPERLGFRLEGELRAVEWIHGASVDHAVYGHLSSDPPPTDA
ncbi:MAG: GNAT family N-acetyltransferase [Planctomycetota bacterium]|nr:GNAT family N-acetyltransferase [Planctomycetota bacterium]